jgi:tight adherence protein B
VRLLAALAVGTCCALVAAALLGTMPRPRSRRGRRNYLAARLDRADTWLQQAGVGLGLLPFWVGSAFAGHSLAQAVTNLATTGPLAMRVAFARFPQLARVLGTGPALELVKEDLADPTSDRVLEVLILAQERGGAIVRNILEDLVDATTRDLKLLDEIETEGLEMRINAKAVVVLPWLVLVALTARPGAFRDFYRSGGGVLTLVLAGFLTAIGVAVLGRLGREPVEARIFASDELM